MFWIDNCNWQIRIVNAHSKYLQRSDGGFALGCTDSYLHTIFICENLDVVQFRNVLCHELTHALSYSKGIDIDEYTEELMCAFVERWADDILLMTYTILDKIV